jgi:hypothetical protein
MRDFPEARWLPLEALADMATKVQTYAGLHRDAWPAEVDSHHDRDTGDLVVYLSFPGETLASVLHGTQSLTDRQIDAGKLVWLRVAEAACRGEFRKRRH